MGNFVELKINSTGRDPQEEQHFNTTDPRTGTPGKLEYTNGEMRDMSPQAVSSSSSNGLPGILGTARGPLGSTGDIHDETMVTVGNQTMSAKIAADLGYLTRDPSGRYVQPGQPEEVAPQEEAPPLEEAPLSYPEQIKVALNEQLSETRADSMANKFINGLDSEDLDGRMETWGNENGVNKASTVAHQVYDAYQKEAVDFVAKALPGEDGMKVLQWAWSTFDSASFAQVMRLHYHGQGDQRMAGYRAIVKEYQRQVKNR